ncbi:MAG TPA: leukotriene A4 hydrolase C-terminal domain-containing protein [Xanthomonadales bacterium]|nr:leukotriene A4 hydrolase C-terminal domain-containing protein [Xanthomonadales bacterium]
MLRTIIPAILALLLGTGCGPDPVGLPAGGAQDPSRDAFTFANTEHFLSRHLELELRVDFDRQTLEGSVIHHVECVQPGADALVLDSRGLRIDRVQLVRPGSEALPLQFEQGSPDPVRGEPLRIGLPANQGCDGEFQLKIEYRTGPGASAIMWLPPDMTAGGEHPFMFTQSQSIHARSWIPLQDTPAVRLTYEAVIRTPPQLLALMSANNVPGAPRNGEYRFSMPQPIPSYLLALAVGNLQFEAFGEDTGVYAEPEVLPLAASEFADTQDMLDAAQATYGPYRWGRYDLLILPPSFPYGGMENPRLSFITPSLLAGDRSLVSVIAHELAHSWSGNLVSNRTWRDIWLNEGTTSYLEARLMEVLYGKDRADEERLLTYQSLLEAMRTVPPEMQPLAPVFESGDPDEGQQGLEYAKGQMLFEHLEALFGREVFDHFMAGYFEHFAFQAISTEQFLEYIDRRLLQLRPETYSREQLEEWLYQPGLPAAMTVPRSANLDAAAGAARAWASGELPVDKLSTKGWSPQAVIYFIKALPPGLAQDRLAALDRRLGLSSSENAEIGRAWFTEVARRRHLPAYAPMRAYLGRYGRTRLIQPVYLELAANGEDLELARAIFGALRPGYHPLTIAALEPQLESRDSD